MAAIPKRRLDQILVERGLAESRSRAQALVMAGLVYSETKRLDKAGTQIPVNMPLELKGQDHPWVSRGGLKLDHGLDHFQFDVTGATCLDVGASTGGFTDVLLSRGAAKVYAVDVGHGQLAWKIRNDERVIVMERTNARHISQQDVPDDINFICCDASFIGLQTVLPAALGLATDGAKLIALIKPQFEVGKDQVGKKGVVRDPVLHQEVCDRISTWLEGLPGWHVAGIEKSPITGPEGNIEFLIAAQYKK
ncbi:MAG: TlyA family RNA methyltransferase [Rhodospirillaceae bacterium]|jgi:23S rRNA (cytidine1920-2'-O)/16S rRNA (cytidine1409-2'-O)-methyltransferase|nr:TlyA family RNA methyltransferase [Rhodospirillaceae bacterium]MBT4588576.1 TlyA family RNA methyltransferase [Rhodospirillaceae bacterium]MBT5941047.1 TlyA family RNA methyltransferase [Rhodospirillaceae bacterium]MBT7265290.1 TlyA family RNA methyltransferase [Rhodospirillaceae bacterium]